MSELIKTFGLDVRILLAQFLSFAIFFFVLYKYAIIPVMKNLEARRKGIKDDLEKAQEAGRSVQKAEEQKEAVILEAKKEAEEILKEAREKAGKERELILAKARKEAQAILTRGREDLLSEEQIMVKKVKTQTGDLVIKALRKILGEKLSGEIEKKFSKDQLNSLAK